MGTHRLQLPPPAIHSYAWKRRYRRLKFSPRRLLETLIFMTPISTESSASGWQRLAVVDLAADGESCSRHVPI